MKLCSITSQNETFYELTMNKHAGFSDTEFIPKNYFCKFQIPVDPEIRWQLKIFRYISLLHVENIEIVVQEGHTALHYFDDKLLRSRSYMYANNGQNFTSHMTMNFKDGASLVEVYVLNNYSVRQKTFKVQLFESKSNFSIVSNIYTILSAMFTMTLCCMCIIGCCKCFMYKGGPIDYD